MFSRSKVITTSSSSSLQCSEAVDGTRSGDYSVRYLASTRRARDSALAQWSTNRLSQDMIFPRGVVERIDSLSASVENFFERHFPHRSQNIVGVELRDGLLREQPALAAAGGSAGGPPPPPRLPREAKRAASSPGDPSFADRAVPVRDLLICLGNALAVSLMGATPLGYAAATLAAGVGVFCYLRHSDHCTTGVALLASISACVVVASLPPLLVSLLSSGAAFVGHNQFLKGSERLISPSLADPSFQTLSLDETLDGLLVGTLSAVTLGLSAYARSTALGLLGTMGAVLVGAYVVDRSENQHLCMPFVI